MRSEILVPPTTTTSNIPIQLPGQPIHLDVLALLKNETRTEAERFEDSSLRSFQVSCLFGTRTEASSPLSMEVRPDRGHSHIRLPSGVRKLDIGNAPTKSLFSLIANDQGIVSAIELNCEANSVSHAKAIFYAAVIPFVDFLSYRTNTPLHINQLSILDRKNLRKHAEMIAPFSTTEFILDPTGVPGMMYPVYAMYREARNSTSPFYRFFCNYKILEGLFNGFRTELQRRAKNLGVNLPPIQDRVPDLQIMNAEQKVFVGKSIHKLFNDYLTTKFRDGVAHFVLTDGTFVHVSAIQHIDQYQALAAITEACTRLVMDHFNSCCKLIGDPPPLPTA
jgi:hypothetical protein